MSDVDQKPTDPKGGGAVVSDRCVAHTTRGFPCGRHADHLVLALPGIEAST